MLFFIVSVKFLSNPFIYSKKFYPYFIKFDSSIIYIFHTLGNLWVYDKVYSEVSIFSVNWSY